MVYRGSVVTHVDALRRARADVLVTVAPWRFKGATSSPLNPLAIF
jgi:hypothetical protein